MSLCFYLYCSLCLNFLSWKREVLHKQQGSTVQYRELHSIFHNDNMGKIKKKKKPDTCICMTEPPHSTSETNTINLQTNYTSIQNKNQIKVNHYIFSTLPGQGSLSHAPVPQIGVIFPFYSSVYFLTSSINVYSMKRWKRVVCRQIQNIISVVFSFFYPQAHSLVLSQEKHQINPNWGTFFRKSEQDVS